MVIGYHCTLYLHSNASYPGCLALPVSRKNCRVCFFVAESEKICHRLEFWPRINALCAPGLQACPYLSRPDKRHLSVLPQKDSFIIMLSYIGNLLLENLKMLVVNTTFPSEHVHILCLLLIASWRSVAASWPLWGWHAVPMWDMMPWKLSRMSAQSLRVRLANNLCINTALVQTLSFRTGSSALFSVDESRFWEYFSY